MPCPPGFPSTSQDLRFFPPLSLSSHVSPPTTTPSQQAHHLLLLFFPWSLMVLNLPPELQPQPASTSPPGWFSGYPLSLHLRTSSFSVSPVTEGTTIHPHPPPSCASSLPVVGHISSNDHNNVSYPTCPSYNVTLTLVLLTDVSTSPPL